MSIDTSSFFRTIFDRSRGAGMLILDEEGIILRVNGAFTQMFGYAEKELAGKSFKILFTAADRVKQLPENELAKTKTQGYSMDDNYLVHQSGKHTWVSGETQCVTDKDGKLYLVKTVQDIHNQKLLEKFLVEANSMVAALFECIRTRAMFVIDRNQTINRINSAAYKVFGITDLDLEGSRISSINHPLWQHDPFKQKINHIFQPTEAGTQVQEWKIRAGNTDYRIDARLIDGYSEAEKRLLLIFTDPHLSN